MSDSVPTDDSSPHAVRGPLGGPDLGERATALAGGARDVLEVAVGLGVLGLLRLQSERPRLEAELERAGLATAAVVTRQAGELLDRGLRRVMASLAG
jgi:hypothetical protein